MKEIPEEKIREQLEAVYRHFQHECMLMEEKVDALFLENKCSDLVYVEVMIRLLTEHACNHDFPEAIFAYYLEKFRIFVPR